MNHIPCFFLEPTPNVRRSLRRFVGTKGACSGPMMYHEAFHPLDVICNPVVENGITNVIDDVPRDHPQWPVKCSHCSYVFDDADVWQTFQERLYQRQDTGELHTLREAPPGAMWDGYWYSDEFQGPDGVSLVVMTPAGEWLVDAPSTSGRPWTRTGTIPHVTASPSIFIENRGGKSYHGFLVNGVLQSV